MNTAHAIAAESLTGYFRSLVKVQCAFDHDGLFETGGMGATPVLKELQSFVLSLYSCLDIGTKLIYALRHMPESFERVPSRIGGNRLFRNEQGGEVSLSGDGLLFEKCWETTYLGCLRDDLIHNRSLDASSRVFTHRAGGKVVERFVLLPDADEKGRICSWKNRNRFYSLELKANDLIPYLFEQISRRLMLGLDETISEIPKSRPLELSLDDVRDVHADIWRAYERFCERLA